MVRFIVLAIIIFSIICCSERSNSYNDAMKRCLENVTTSEFELEDGRKGTAYNNFDINCIKGAQLPNFKTESLSGNGYDTEDLLGKINIINFWFKACKPCVAKIPGLNLIADRYKNEGINFLSLSIDDENTLKEFVMRNEFQFTHLLNGKEIIKEQFKHISGYPTTIITNSNLEIVEILTGGKSDSTAVKEIITKLDPIIKNLIEKNDYH